MHNLLIKHQITGRYGYFDDILSVCDESITHINTTMTEFNTINPAILFMAGNEETKN
jgi:hypothetical protein